MEAVQTIDERIEAIHQEIAAKHEEIVNLRKERPSESINDYELKDKNGNFAIIIEPIPHFSPCSPTPGAILSSACEIKCSAPEHGLLLPAIHEATPALINASTITRASNPFFPY